DDDRVVLVRGRIHEEHCSEACLQETTSRRRRAREAAQLRWLARIALVAVVVAGGRHLWRRHRLPPAHSISLDAVDANARPAAPPPTTTKFVFGPAWPPSDTDYMAMFAAAKWVYPLPGPRRRQPVADARIL